MLYLNVCECFGKLNIKILNVEILKETIYESLFLRLNPFISEDKLCNKEFPLKS